MGTFRNFRVKHLFIGVLAATGLSISGADAATVLWDFSVGAGGNQGTTLTQDSVPFGIPIVASGFTGIIGTPTDLFRKEAGGDEVGLGLTNDPTGEDEITPGSFIQLDLSALTIPPLTSLTRRSPQTARHRRMSGRYSCRTPLAYIRYFRVRRAPPSFRRSSRSTRPDSGSWM